MKKTIIVVTQLLFLWLLNELGYFLVSSFDLPIPGSVIGMIILFLLLITGVVKLTWIDDASSLLIKHLAFFFIPIAVGLMNFGALFLKSGLSFLVVMIGSIVVGILVTGVVSQGLVIKKGGAEDGRIRHTA
ncbi:CidA/LrgA family protein [Bacillus marasmi]|uniref:CidA/LrgA family protein n=1 Tax=Bacillus marasmi TaxID=1926279 RepID=UPI0011C7B7F4|nr:CidA/LrgA family protein [Bacillus marasmi]